MSLGVKGLRVLGHMTLSCKRPIIPPPPLPYYFLVVSYIRLLSQSNSCEFNSHPLFLSQDALHLPRRPYLHTTSIVLTVAPLLQVCFAQNNPSLKSLPFMFTVAVLSHHLRDSNRRGLWFWPFGTTPPLPQWLYISCTLVLPYLVGMAIQLIENMPNKVPEEHSN